MGVVKRQMEVNILNEPLPQARNREELLEGVMQKEAWRRVCECKKRPVERIENWKGLCDPIMGFLRKDKVLRKVAVMDTVRIPFIRNRYGTER